ncbi:N/A [soil metagenome]
MSSDVSLLMISSKTGKIVGECRRAGHVDEIDIEGWSFGAQNFSEPNGRTSKVSIDEVHLQKIVDRSSLVIFKACSTGEVFKEATLTARKAGDNDDYMTIKMLSVQVSAVQTSGSGGNSLPSESFSLNFLGYIMTYRTQNPDGSLGPASSVEFHKTVR